MWRTVKFNKRTTMTFKNKTYTTTDPKSRMNYLLSNNPTGELIHYLSRVYKVSRRKRKNI